MNKKISITLASLALVGGVLAGCNKGKGGEAKTVSGVQLKGMFTAYAPDETIDWSKVSLVITYSDKTTTTISAADIEFDVETPVNANTKAVISTDGLHGAELPTEKDYNMSVKLVGETQSYNAGAISVDSITPDKYDLQSFFAPSFIDVYNKTMENAGETEGTAEQLETYFKKGDEIFTVGNMNVFKFIPEVTFMKKGGSITSGGLKMTNSYKKTVTVEEHTDGYIAASNSDYEVVREGIKFAESAVGKTFRITVKPEQFTVTKPAQFEFKVEKGLNIYSAKELGALNLNSLKAEDNVGDVYYEVTYGFKAGVGVAENGNDPIFPNAANSGYERKDTFKMWRDFLKNSGTYSESEMISYTDAPAYFFMNNLTVKPEDLPGEFFIKDGELANIGNKVTGSLRDGIHLYHVLPNIAKVINGNYFNVDTSNIPLCMSECKSSGLDIIESTDATVNPGHAIAFYVPGQKHRDNDSYMTSSTYESGTKQVVFKNINTIGNTGNDLGHTKIEGDENFAKMAKLTGLVAFKSGMAPVQVNNCIIKQYMIGDMANFNLATYNGEPAAQLNDSRIYDCANAGAFNYECQNFSVKNSELKRFGGSAIFNACHATKAYYGAYTYVDSASKVENYVTGDEVYFTAVGASGQIAEIKAFNEIMAGNKFIHNIKGAEYMNVVSLTMEEGYMGSKDHTYFGGTVLKNGTGSDTKIDLMDPANPCGQIVNAVHNMIGAYVPVATFDGTMNVQGMGTIPGYMAGAIAFPTVQAIPNIGDVPAGMYVPDMSAGLNLLPVTGYTANYLHIALPINATGEGPTLSMILGL